MIGQEHDDVFSLGIAESVRARCSGNALDANNPFIIYVAMGLNVFMRCCRSFRCEGTYSPPTLTRICCLDLVSVDNRHNSSYFSSASPEQSLSIRTVFEAAANAAS